MSLLPPLADEFLGGRLLRAREQGSAKNIKKQNRAVRISFFLLFTDERSL
jgi:hypothetical protein